MKVVSQLWIDSDHPSLAGHFPGNPIVPAVVILERAMTEISRLCPDCRVTGISQAKFLSPLQPGDHMQLVLKWGDPGVVRFDCTIGERRIAMGRFDVEAEAADGQHS